MNGKVDLHFYFKFEARSTSLEKTNAELEKPLKTENCSTSASW